MEKTAANSGRGMDIVLAVAAPLAILSTPVVKFIMFYGYGFGHLEVAVIFAGLVAVALALAAVMALRAETLRPVGLSVLIVGFGYGEFKRAEPLEWLSMDLVGEVLLAGAAFGGILWLAWAVRAWLNVLVVTVFGSMMVSMVLFQPAPPDAWEVRSQAVDVAGSRPPVLHVVLDQQIGIGGLPPGIAGSRELAADLRAFYADYGFTLFTRAFTHFPESAYSISNLLNGEVRSNAWRYHDGGPDYVRLKQNAWFRQLAKSGTTIDVVQSRFFDFCAADDASRKAIRVCSVYNHDDVRFFHDLDMGPLAKAKLLFAYFLWSDFRPLLARILYAYDNVRRRLVARWGFNWPAWVYKPIAPRALVARDAMSRLSDRAQELKAGQAVFAHILLPHDPYMFDPACGVAEDRGGWARRRSPLWEFNVGNSPDARARSYGAYLKQVRCVHTLLGVMFDKMRAAGAWDDTTVIIHGDHGSTIGLTEVHPLNAGRLRDRDIVDYFSTHFAIKIPGSPAGEVDVQQSIQSLFAERFLGRTGIKVHDGIYLKTDHFSVGPSQTWRKMVPIN